jgi:hypothetical protein
VNASISSQEIIPEHEAITQYVGPATCVACHENEAKAMFGSVHYQWSGPTPNVPNIDGNAGKGDLGFNTYCGTVVGSRRISCWTCHAGNGKVPSSTVSTEQLNNIDCLMCHHELYKRKAGGPFETVTYMGHDGVTRSWQLPVEDEAGNFQFIPDEANMAVSILQAARTVHRPNRSTCLRCHAYAAGTDCGKRGDISSASISPPADFEVHMSPEGANLSCQDCHQMRNHRVLGRGLDLRVNDVPERLTCISGGCHSPVPHGNARLDNHTARVACQTCHIPTYAKLQQLGTETRRDWRFPFFAKGLFGGQGGFKPEEIRGVNLIPTYAWYDGTSRVYVLGQAPAQNDRGEFALGTPIGTVSSAGAMIHPMKEHLSNSAMHDATGQLIPHSTFKYFVTGDFDQAVADGMALAGLAGAWTLVDVHTYQTINHGVEPTSNALSCGQCHPPLSNGDPLRMDLKNKLGYALKAETSQVCAQCHEVKPSKGFTVTHDKHVKDKKYDCAWCHGFTRPERALTPPPGTCPGDLNGDHDVNDQDLALLALDFGKAGCGGPCKGDLDQDADVDGLDLAIMTVELIRTDCQ